ncbi:MAG: hypothetical protein ACTHKS_02265 [Gaiellaceae bacterium]
MRRRLLLFVLLAGLTMSSTALATPVFSLKLGSTFHITGRTGSAPGTHTRALGRVVLSGRWGTGPWRWITTTKTDNEGYYRFGVTPGRRGNLTLRITPPDHHLRFYLLRVR